MKPRAILATAFEPFAGRRQNSSDIFLRSIDSQAVFEILRFHVEKRILPVSWDRSVAKLKEYHGQIFPDLLISFGEAPISKIHLELRGQNLCRSKVSDNDGWFISEKKIDENQREFISSPWEKLSLMGSSFLKEHVSDVQESFNAGAFLCNRVLFEMLNKPQDLPTRFPSGFIHIPIGFELRFKNHQELSRYTTRFFCNFVSAIMESLK